MLEVRATVNLYGVSAGEFVLVDPSDPYIAKMLRAKWLVPKGEMPPGDATITAPGDTGDQREVDL